GFEPSGTHEHQRGNHLWLRAYEAMPVSRHPGGDMHLCEPQMLEKLDEPPGNSTFCIHGHRSVSCLKRHTCSVLSSRLPLYLAAVSYAASPIRSTAWCIPSSERMHSILLLPGEEADMLRTRVATRCRLVRNRLSRPGGPEWH